MTTNGKGGGDIMSDDEHLIQNIVCLVEEVGWDKFCDFPLTDQVGEYYKDYGTNGNITVNKETFKWLIAMASYIDYERKVWNHFLPTVEDITEENEIVYKFLEYRNKMKELSFEILKKIYDKLSQEEFFKERNIKIGKGLVQYDNERYDGIIIDSKLKDFKYSIFIKNGKLHMWRKEDELRYYHLEEFIELNYNREIQHSIKYIEENGGKND